MVQAQVNLAQVPSRNCKNITLRHLLVLLMQCRFHIKNISEGSIDLDEFPASRVWQLKKKFEGSKATACHMKHVAGDPQATQINLMHHQQTELPTNKHNKKRRPIGKLKPYKAPENQVYQVKKQYDNKKVNRNS